MFKHHLGSYIQVFSHVVNSSQYNSLKNRQTTHVTKAQVHLLTLTSIRSTTHRDGILATCQKVETRMDIYRVWGEDLDSCDLR